jgi:hypothetical protein
MGFPKDTYVDSQQIEQMFLTAKQHLMYSVLIEEYRKEIENKKHSKEAFEKGGHLYRILPKILLPFQTQKYAGFESEEREMKIDRARIERTLLQGIEQFEGLFMGIESGKESIIRTKMPPRYSGEAILYCETGLLSQTYELQWPEGPKAKINAYSSHKYPKIWLGHMSSGTSDVTKFPKNRQAFLDCILGHKYPQMNTTKELSFWDANFDLTDNINSHYNMESTISILLDVSRHHPIQFIIPRVRVQKKRYKNRPFANNQVSKGEEQIAESMVATSPRTCTIQAIDSDGLYVLNNEGIFEHMMNRPSKKVLLDELVWNKHKALSSDVILDHKPICVEIDQHKYQFHNFMNFKGNKGIPDPYWYDEAKLMEMEQIFVQFLCQITT